MIYNEDDHIVITGRNERWKAEYDAGQVAGPMVFELSGATLLQSCRSAFDDLDESLALPNDVRAFRKGKAAIHQVKGVMPFGSGIGFNYTHRFSDNLMRVIKDFKMEPGTQLRDRMAVDTLSIDGRFTHMRTVDQDCRLTPWQPITEETLTWDQHPLVLVFRREDGRELELGVGNDIWRWQAGIAGDRNRGLYELECTEVSLRFFRYVTLGSAKNPVVPMPRAYRFTWYMAWDEGEKNAAFPESIPVEWRDGGDIDVTTLVADLQGKADRAIEIDVRLANWPESLRRPDGSPCFCSSNVAKRLKRVVRQLTNLNLDNPVLFKGLRPNGCQTGRHVDRKESNRHWDLVSLADFGTWARQAFGDDRVLLVDPEDFSTPSTRTLFEPTDHDVAAIEYEWDPQKLEESNGL